MRTLEIATQHDAPPGCESVIIAPNAELNLDASCHKVICQCDCTLRAVMGCLLETRQILQIMAAGGKMRTSGPNYPDDPSYPRYESDDCYHTFGSDDGGFMKLLRAKEGCAAEVIDYHILEELAAAIKDPSSAPKRSTQ